MLGAFQLNLEVAETKLVIGIENWLKYEMREKEKLERIEESARNVLVCQRALHAHVPMCFACSRVYVLYMLTCLTCSHVLRSHVATFVACSCANMPTCRFCVISLTHRFFDVLRKSRRVFNCSWRKKEIYNKILKIFIIRF